MSAWGHSWLRRWGASWGAATQDFSEYLLDDSVTPVFLETPKETLLTRVERVIFNEQRPFVVHYQSRERCFVKL